MSTVTLDNPAAVQDRLEAIEGDLAELQNDIESAAIVWYRLKRDREKEHAVQFLSAEGTVAERSAHADRETALIGVSEEGTYEALKAKARVLDTRAAIGMSLLRAQTRGGGA